MYSNRDVEEIYRMPLSELVFKASKTHQKNFDSTHVQASQLLSIKTGGCPENCSYCPQSAHYQTSVAKEPLMPLEEIREKAQAALKAGATRLCMGAAWREVRDGPDFDHVLKAVKLVHDMKLEVCCTLGMISYQQAIRLKEAGLFAYNHNIDTSKDFYKKIITTRDFKERLQTIDNVRRAGITVCTGGILGLGESDEDRIAFLQTLANLNPQPESVTINTLVPFEGTPLAEQDPIDPVVIIRVIATARLLMEKSFIRLSAGRKQRTLLEQFLCMHVGANSIFFGEKLLTSSNPALDEDREMLRRLDKELMT